MKVQFVDLKTQYSEIKEEILQAINEVLDNNAYILGKSVASFEEGFANFCQAKYAVALNSGTAALHLALLGYNIGQGDEVITVPNTFIATAEGISHAGARPVFVDINPQTYNMDPDKIEEKITSKTKAIIPVHLYGQPCDMEPIMELAKRYNLVVIEDACQAHGAEDKGQRVGSIGQAAAFSFYPGKNLGAYGEGGMVTTNDAEVATKIRILRDHGSSQKYFHQYIGYNYRMEGIQGAVLGVKLKRLDQWTQRRRQNAEIYHQLLSSCPEVITPKEENSCKHVYHLYVIRVKNRDKLQEYLKENNIETGLHYPLPIHLQKAYQFLGYQEGNFPISETASKEILSLPMHPELTYQQIEKVVNTIKEFLSK
ncbi:DegT/DnrJ/EryC1/StrS family aminotransferase [bacterium]|nr:DegT/DnrJ/EryC1/StrS family aminotransferase [bacterium]MBU0899752.1 DegT/DnrJ/EryC1/StrS family aminotransferase [bacterium]MBU1153962.1 DegT/DnrJ/EryC1/StrS family aminotransferase [bacterium]MBU1782011.1 DegT/DnrJ/EryC1/StrS family aminotransferase [bacterium]